MRKLLLLVAMIAGAIASAGLLLHLTVRDDVAALAFFFYATPMPLVAAGAAVASVAALVAQRRALAFALLFVTLVSAAVWTRSWRSAPQAEGTIRLLAWNGGRLAETDRAADFVRSRDADIDVVVELRGYDNHTQRIWRRALAPKKVDAMRGSMLVSADSLGRPQFFQFGRRSRVNVTEVKVDGEAITVAIVDFDANPFRSRHSDFEALGHILDTYDAKRLVVAGDFNTPAESRGFDPFRRRGLRNAFEVAGNGRPETWPRWVPLLTLDQIWVGPGIEVTGCRKVSTPLSDHLAVLAELKLK